MLELYKAILLGAVQGVSEFLPISSTGHLILVEQVLGISQATFGLAFDAALHLGTLVAIIWYFRPEFIALTTTMYRYIVVGDRKKLSEQHLLKLLVYGTVPAVFFGLLFEDVIDTVFRSPVLVGAMLIIFSAVLIYVEKFGIRRKLIKDLGVIDSLIIGLAQSVALIPGVSRSGITLAAGIYRQLTRAEAAKFAFLLSAPIVAGAGGKQLINTISLFNNGQITASVLIFFIVGIVTAAIFGYLTIKYFLKYISNHTLYPFIIYRIALGIVILLFLSQ